MESLIDDRAVLDDDDESLDDETGDASKDRHAIAEGFIVDEDEEDDEATREERRRLKKLAREERKRKRDQEVGDQELDDEDLELIGVRKSPAEAAPSKFKRLKRGPREEHNGDRRGVDDIFASDEEDDAADHGVRQRPFGRRGDDEMEGFIEEDYFSDEADQQREDEEVARRPARRGMVDLSAADAAGLDPQALEDFRAAFGDGNDYNFALDIEDQEDDDEAEKDRHLTLKDVFEPSQLEEKMLADADLDIVRTDIPERHQLARQPYKDVELTEDEFREETDWACKLLLAKKNLRPELHEPFKECVREVLNLLVIQEFEVPFIINNRKDYLIHVTRSVVGQKADGSPEINTRPEMMLEQADLWDVFELDLKYRAFIEKRQAIQKAYGSLKENNIASDPILEAFLPTAETVEELQDLQDYLHFQYASQLKDLTLTNGSSANGANGTAVSRKRTTTKSLYEAIRSSRAYALVRAYGITANAVAQNAAKIGVHTYTDDPSERIEDLADSLVDDEYPTGTMVRKAAKSMFIQELVMDPDFRKLVRRNVYTHGVFDCYRTQKGLRQIDEEHPYYEFKYLRNQDFRVFVSDPAMFLKMLKAEEEELIEVKLRLANLDQFRAQLFKSIESDNSSSLADSWNKERKDVVVAALSRVMQLLTSSTKANLRNECEDLILKECKEEFADRLDQAPYQPRGMKKGTTPRVLALSNGSGIPGRDPIAYAFVNDDGRVLENGKFVDLAPGDSERGLPEGRDVAAFLALIRRKKPEVIGVSGESPETRKLQHYLVTLVKDHDLRGEPYEEDGDPERTDLLDVVLVNNEVARLYKASDRAKTDNPGLPPLTHYCVALAKYLQDPIKQYALLGRDITSITFHSAQNLVDQAKLLKKLEMALVDNVNLVGVDIDEALVDPALAALLPYVAGLGPRKAANLIKTCLLNGGRVGGRFELLGLLPGDETLAHIPLTQRVWQNAASFLNIPWDDQIETSEYLDGTRIHPDDYDIARKMAADALELDEEDIEEETRNGGPAAILRRLVKQDAQDRVNDLVLEEYAEQLEKNLNAKKRSTLENIRAEIQDPYEELRRDFRDRLSTSQIFTMLTGETKDSIDKGMNIPITLKRITDSYVEGLLDCGMVAVVEEGAWTDLVDPSTGLSLSPKQIFTLHQTVQAHITDIKHADFQVTVSLRDEAIKHPYRPFDPRTLPHNEWDDQQERDDRKVLEQKSGAGVRTTRVIKHPLFKPFNSKQAEEYLASQQRGDLVIRPSSKGIDHLAVTWKVADGIFQHLDVLEINKENEFALGKVLRILGVGGKQHNYSDLDELIVNHVKAMSRKVEEMVANEKFQDKTKSQLEEWLTTYSAANPKRAMYQYCLNREKPGAFHLLFKAGQNHQLQDWAVRVIPGGFWLGGHEFPNMTALSNGFKIQFQNRLNERKAGIVAH
ncbi:hypothetical protein DV735_g2784, partial [Chaetothyriales sp. CBS 134920]